MEVHQIPIGLDGDDDPGDGLRILAGRPEEGLQGVGGALASLPEEAAILLEVDAEPLGDRKDVLALGDRGQDLVGQPASELKHPLLMAGRAEVPAFARERQQILMAAGIAPDPGEPLARMPENDRRCPTGSRSWSVRDGNSLFQGIAKHGQIGYPRSACQEESRR